MLCHCCERRGRCYVGALETRYYGSGASESVEGEVRRADPFSVNPGQRVRGWSGKGDMHRKAVPL